MGRAARVLLAAAVFLAITPVPTASAVQADASADLPALPSIPTLDPASASLSPGGRAFLQGASLTDAPRYALTATIDPATGKVDGRVRAEVSRPEQGDLHFRMLAGLPALSGFGDIGNFAAGAITARVRVPTGYDVVSGGSTVDRQESAGHTTVTESGVGLRDLSLAIGRGLHSASAQSGDVTVRATGPASVDVDAAARAGAADLQTLAGLYGPYPWSELDIVAVSLGPDAGGMEWPGAVWIRGLGD